MIFPARHETIKESSKAVESNALDISAATHELAAGAEQFSATTQVVVENFQDQVIKALSFETA